LTARWLSMVCSSVSCIAPFASSSQTCSIHIRIISSNTSPLRPSGVLCSLRPAMFEGLDGGDGAISSEFESTVWRRLNTAGASQQVLREGFPTGHNLGMDTPSGSDAMATEREETAPRPRKPKRKAKKGDKATGTSAAAAASSGSSGLHLPKISDVTNNKELKKLLGAMTKQILLTAMLARESLGILLDCFILPADSPIIESISKRGRWYSEKTKELGKGHGLGPPGPLFFASLLTSLLEKKNDIGGNTRKYLSVIAGFMRSLEMQDCSTIVRACRVTRVYDSSKRRLLVALADGEMLQMMPKLVRDELSSLSEQGFSTRTALRRALSELGALYLMGKAPAGGLERALQAAVGGQQAGETLPQGPN